MPRLTLILGAVLVALGVISYIATAFASWTALIPAILGVVLFGLGLLALKRQKLGIHIALVVALVGAVGTVTNVVQLGSVFAGTAERPVAVIVSTVTFLLLLIYIGLGVRSFVAARRWRREQGATG